MKDYKEAFEREVSETSDFLFESVQSSKTNAKISHYTRALAVNAIFVNGTIRFTRWDFLNDMSEFTYVYGLVKEALETGDYEEEFCRYMREISDIHYTLRKSTEYPKTEDYYVASFSFNHDCLPLWSNYAKMNEADGYSIQFSRHDLRKSLQRKNGVTIYQGCVIYDVETQKALVGKILSSLNTLYGIMEDEAERAERVAACFEEYISIVAGFFKHPSFANEEEFRFVYKCSKDETRYPIKTRVLNGIIIPCIDLEFDREICEKITVSPAVNPVTAQNGLRFLRELVGGRFDIAVSCIPYRNI